MSDRLPIQDLYAPEFAHCYGCGRLNEQGLQIKSHWDGQEAVALFTPPPEQIGYPGFIYGGLLAALIDCHAMATAAAAACTAEGRPLDSANVTGFVTAALNVEYRVPTPAGKTLELRARAVEVGRRKVLVEVELSAGGKPCVSGRVVAVRIPEHMQGGAAATGGTGPR